MNTPASGSSTANRDDSWESQRVMLFNGQGDTRKASGTTYATTSLGEIFLQAAAPKTLPKSKAPAIIPSSYCEQDGRNHETQREHGRFIAVSGDIDGGNHPLERVVDLTTKFFGRVAHLIYSTSSATADTPKWRILVPLSRPIAFVEWSNLSTAFYDFADAQGVKMDRCLARAGQPMYLPNVPPERRGANGQPLFYDFVVNTGSAADPASSVAADWVGRLQERKRADEAEKARARAEAAAARPFKPTSTSNQLTPIEYFNATHTVADTLTACGYQECPNRPGHWRSPLQTTDSYATQDCGDYWVSLSGSDQVAGIGIPTKNGYQTGDAFSLYKHFVHHGDNEAAVRAAGSLMPLQDPMRQWSTTIPATPPDGTYYKLMTSAELTKQKRPAWLVRNIVPARGLMAIFGQSGSGKTFLILDMLGAVTRGVPWFGHKTKACHATYIALEGETGIINRVAAYEKRDGALPINLKFVSQPFNLLSGVDIQNLATALVAADGRDGIICIDTLNRASPGADENDAKDMGDLIAAATYLQSLMGGVVLLVHHTGKDQKKGMRGHSSLIAALDMAIEVVGGPARSWHVRKSNDGRDDIGSGFRLDEVELGVDEEGERISSCVVAADDFSPSPQAKPLTLSARQAIAAYKTVAIRTAEAAVRGVPLRNWRDEFFRISTANSPEGKKKAFTRARDALQEIAALVVDGDYNRITLLT